MNEVQKSLAILGSYFILIIDISALVVFEGHIYFDYKP